MGKTQARNTFNHYFGYMLKSMAGIPHTLFSQNSHLRHQLFDLQINIGGSDFNWFGSLATLCMPCLYSVSFRPTDCKLISALNAMRLSFSLQGEVHRGMLQCSPCWLSGLPSVINWNPWQAALSIRCLQLFPCLCPPPSWAAIPLNLLTSM